MKILNTGYVYRILLNEIWNSAKENAPKREKTQGKICELKITCEHVCSIPRLIENV